MMNLLHVIHTLDPASGGTAEAVRNFVRHALDSRQAVLTMDRETDPWIKNLSSDAFCLDPGFGKYGYSPRASEWFRERIKRYDAVIIHGCWQYHGVAASRQARRTGVPYFVFPHGMLDPYFQHAAPVSHLKKRLYWTFERKILENASSVLFTCSEEAARAHQGFAFRSRDQIVPLGIDSLSHSAVSSKLILERFPHLAGKRTLLFLGRLHPKKGVDLIIQAIAKIPDPTFHLLIAGPLGTEPYIGQLNELARSVPGRVTFAGLLTGVMKQSALSIADAFILPSHQENFGLSIVEALSSGLPVLISDKVNIWREIVADGAGFVAPDDDAGTLHVLQKWLALSSADVLRMRDAAKKSFETHFRADVSSSKLLTSIRKSISSSHEQSSSSLQFARA